jgi:regulator of microtubule dynamics protein 3
MESPFVIVSGSSIFRLQPALALLGLCLATLTSSIAAQQAADHVAMGVAANEAHDVRTAFQHFQAALDQDSSNYEANWRGAMTLLTLGEQLPGKSKHPERDSLYALAEHYARRAVAADPAGADGHFALASAIGQASLTKGQRERIRRAAVIRREARRTLALNPRHDGAYHILGRWNAEIMRISGLSRFFARNFLGAGVFNQASWGKAIYNMEKAVELDPGRIYHRLELAEIYADRKRFADAATQLQLVDSLPLREVMDSIYKRQAAALGRRLARR